MSRQAVNLNTILLMVAVWPGQTDYQLTERLGIRQTYKGRCQPYTYPVRRALWQLAREGYAFSRDEPGGRGNRGWRRAWYAAGSRL